MTRVLHPSLRALLPALLIAFALLAVQPGTAQPTPGDADILAPLWNQIAAQPHDVALACAVLDAPGTPLRYQADQRFPLASLTKVLIFIEYARRLDAGRIAWSDTVPISTLNQYHLPGTDRGAHEAFLALYPPQIDALPLWDVAVGGMIQFSSNAASDYLLARLGPVDWAALYALLGLTHTDPPHALTLIPLLMNTHEAGRASFASVPRLSLMDGAALLERYLTDPVWREAEIAYRAESRSDFPAWRTQAAILQQHTATGTPDDFMAVLRAIYGADSPLSPSVRTLTRAALRWDNYDAIDAQYQEYGSKLGVYSGGTLALIAYGDPLGAAPSVISAVFFRQIPRATYRTLVATDAIGELAHWLNLTGCAGIAGRLP